jgi:Ca-activated chloride channel family protein
MTWRPIALTAGAACIVQMSVPANAQRFTSQAIAVRVDVLVTDDKKLVTGLTAADFELRDMGVAQDVKQIDVEQLPLNLVLAFDTSQSMEGERMAALLAAANGVVAGLREPDRVALVSFATGVRLLSPLTSSRPQITAALNQLSAYGATSLRDAVFAALALRQEDSGRTLVLIFTDGDDTSSWLTAPKVVEAAKHTDAVVYAIGMRQQPRFAFNPALQMPTVVGRSETEDLGAFLRKVAEETGGRAFFASTNADLRTTFGRTLDEFRNRYVLSYTPTGVSAVGWHPLNVKLKSKRGNVTARRGYFAEGASPSSR